MSTIGRKLNDLLAQAATAGASGAGPLLLDLVHLLVGDDVPEGRSLRELLEELAHKLFDRAPADERLMLAEHIGTLETAPRSLVAHIARQPIEIACHVLRSPSLCRAQLPALIDKTGPDHRRLLAERDDIDAGLAAALVAYGEEAVVRTLAANFQATLSAETMQRLVHLSARFRGLQISLLQRTDLSPTTLKSLYAVVSATLQGYIDRRFGRRLQEEMRNEKALATVEEMAELGRLRPSFVTRALHERDSELVAAVLAHFSALPFALMRATVRQSAAGPLARLCRAIGIGRPGFETILVLNRRLQGLDTILDETETREVEEVFPRALAISRAADCAA